jgi:hypothetical protein
VPGSIQAIVAVFFAVLPGALYVWGVERFIGKWSLRSPDRLLRFVAVSAIFHVLAAPATYWLFHRYVDSDEWRAGNHLPVGLWAALLVYVAFPFALGVVVGARSANERITVEALVSPRNDPPRAWDYFFATQPDGWIRCRLKSGLWIGGAYAQGSYAAGYPEDGDLYLATLADIDAQSGEFAFDSDGAVTLRDASLLVRWEEIEYLEFIDG